jgi:hypothetical protein
MNQRPVEQPKVSGALASRLDRLPRDETIQLIVRLNTPPMHDPPGDRAARRANRAAAVDAVRVAARSALSEVDEILARFHGRRLSPDVNALGTILVETTAEGAHALAASRQVRTLLDNQSVQGMYSNTA